MNLLVTGGSGFVGRGLLRFFAERGVGGVATGRTSPPDLPAGWRGEPRAAVLSDEVLLEGIETVVHLEVKQHVPRPSVADEAEFHRVNVAGTGEWLAWAARHGIGRFVLLSTIKAVASADTPRTETAPRAPDTAYGRSKAAAEQAVQDWAEADATRRAVILRPAPVYGPGNEANLAAFVRQILAGKPCLIGRGQTRKSVVSRTNLAAAIAFAAERIRPGCEIFNVSDHETFSLSELANLIAELAQAPRPRSIPGPLAAFVAGTGDIYEAITGRSFPLTSARLRAVRETSVFPADRLVAAGYRHPQSTREGLAEMLDWVKRQG